MSKAHVVGMIRLLRRFGPLPKRRRLPRQQQPDTLRLEYYKALLPIVHAAQAPFHSVRGRVLRLLMSELDTRQDSPNRDYAEQLIEQARAESVNDMSSRRTRDVARRFGSRVASFQREQLDKQVQAGLGIPLAAIEPHVVAKVEEFAAQNVTLIQSVSERYYDRIRLDVERAFAEGQRPEDLADLFVERDGMAERDAMRIARDQIGKLNGEINQERQENLGITSYIWRTANDERVRDEHQEREGQHYEWDDAPEGGHPGEEIMCRCYAEPDLSDILESI